MLSVNDALSYDRDAIGIGRKGTIDRPYILKAPFWTVDTLFYAIPREKVDLNFAFDIFQNIDWKKKDESTGVPSLSKTAINDIDVLAPKHGEQQTIGQFFAAIDHLITLHQRQPFLHSPPDISLIVQLTPPFYTFSWEQRKLGDCFTERVESMPDGELISVTINDGIKKFSELGRHDNSNDDKSKYKKVCIGDIAYNSMRMWQGASGYSPYEGIVSPAYTVLSPNSGINSKCLAYQFKLPDMIHTFQINSQGITSDNWNLKYPALSEIKIFVSKDEKEQEQIAEYFTDLDHLITLHQRQAIVYAVIRSIRKVILAERQYFAPPMVRKSP